MTTRRGLFLLTVLLGQTCAATGGPPDAADPEQLRAEFNRLAAEVKELSARGALAEAVRKQQQELAISRQLFPASAYPDGHPTIATGLNNLGFFLRGLGRFEEARAVLDESLAMRRRLYPASKYPDGHPHLAASLTNTGGLYWSVGRYEEALNLYEQALAMNRRLYPESKYPDGHPDIAGGLFNRATVLLSLGRGPEALTAQEEALAMRRKLYPATKYPDGHPALAASLNGLGSVLRAMGRREPALDYFRQALEMNRKLYPEAKAPGGHQAVAGCLYNLAISTASLGRFDEALGYLDQALAMGRSLYPLARSPLGHPFLAAVLNHRGYVLTQLGRLEEARAALEEALAMNRRLFPAARYPNGHPALAGALTNLGNLCAIQGRFDEAQRYYEEALTVQAREVDRLVAGAGEVEALRYVQSLPTTRDSLLRVTRGRPADAAGLYACLWPVGSAVGRVFERRRRALEAHPGAEWDELTDTRRRLARLLLTPDRSPADEAQVRALSERREQLERALAARRPAPAGELNRLGPADLQRLLPADAAFVDLIRYNAGPDGGPGRREELYAAFVLTRDRTERVELGEAGPTEAAVEAWHRAIAAGQDSPAAGELRRRVWEPIARALPPRAATVYLAGDNDLAILPWGALPGDGGAGVLLERYAFAQVPDGRFLLARLREPAAATTGGTLLAVGAVAYGGGPAAVRHGWGDLPGTRRELDVLRRLGGDGLTVLDGPRAGTDRLLAELPKARVAHLATHGYFEWEAYRAEAERLTEELRTHQPEPGRPAQFAVAPHHPLSFAGLVLAGAGQPAAAGPDGGLLSAEAVAGLPLTNLHLAVLSACQTDRGVIADGQCVLSLARAFHAAGCRNVVASLWKVDDDATAALMALFYDKLLREKKPPLVALREAQLTLYRNPSLVAPLARSPDLAGRLRDSPFAKSVPLPGGPAPASPAATRAPTRLWAAFVLGGPGQ